MADPQAKKEEYRTIKWLEKSQQAVWERKKRNKDPIEPSSIVQNKNPHEVAMELLAKEWLTTQTDLTTRLYLAEQVLPILVVSLEQLLVEVSRKSLEDQQDFRDDFNPVNYVAQFLMRHNPRYLQLPLTSSSLYSNGMKEVAIKLRKLAIDGEENREEKVRQQLRNKREAEEKEHKARIEEEARRKSLLGIIGREWSGPDGIPALQIQQVIKQFIKLNEDQFKEIFNTFIDQQLDQDDLWSEQQLTEKLLPFSLTLSNDNFTQLTSHLIACGEERYRMKMRDNRRSIFKEVFVRCDKSNLSVLDRQYLMTLFTTFYENSSDDVKKQLTNPRTWPASGQEDEVIKEEEQVWETEGSTVSDEDYQQFMNSPSHPMPTMSETQSSVPDPQASAPVTQTSEPQTSPLVTQTSEPQTSAPDTQTSEPQTSAPDTQTSEPQTSPPVTQTLEPQTSPPVTQTSESQNSAPETQTSDPQTSAPDTRTSEPQTSPSVTQTSESQNNAPETQPSEPESQTNVPPSNSKTSEPETLPSESEPTTSVPPTPFVEPADILQPLPVTPAVLPNGPGEQWSPSHIGLPQFMQLCDLLLGDRPDISIVDSLAAFLKTNYIKGDSDIEESGTSDQVQRAFFQLKKAQRISELFTLWDSDCSGFIHVDDLMAVLSRWTTFANEEGQRQVLAGLEGLGVISRHISRLRFSGLLEMLTDDMTTMEFKEFMDLTTSLVKVTQEQLIRSEVRQKLLNDIKRASYNNVGQIKVALGAAVKAIQQDCSQFGGGKRVCVSIGLLERSSNNSLYLSYKAASDDSAYHILGRKLNQSNAPVSFTAVSQRRQVHVEDVYKHGSVFFFIPAHAKKEEYRGSLVVSPIVLPSGQVIGTINVDFIVPNTKSEQVFANHEIAFYQGVGICLGEIYSTSIARKKLLGVAEAGMMWLIRRCPAIQQIDFYLIRPGNKEEEYSLQLALHCDQKSNGKIIHCNEIVYKKDNFFKDYIFECVDTSESVSAEAYCLPHLCSPLRDLSGCAMAVLDFTLTHHTNALGSQYVHDINKMIKLLTSAFHQVATSTTVGIQDEDSMSVLFHKLLLADLQYCMKKLNKRTFAELRSYIDPPQVILHTVQVLLMIVYPTVECTTWTQCKTHIIIELLKIMQEFKLDMNQIHPRLDEILQILQDVSPREVFHHGSLPTKYLYTWVSACSAVLEHSSNAVKEVFVEHLKANNDDDDESITSY